MYGARFVKLFYDEFDEEKLRELKHKHYDYHVRPTDINSPRTRSARTVTKNMERHGVLFDREYSDIKELIERSIEGENLPQALGYLRVFEEWLS